MCIIRSLVSSIPPPPTSIPVVIDVATNVIKLFMYSCSLILQSLNYVLEYFPLNERLLAGLKVMTRNDCKMLINNMLLEMIIPIMMYLKCKMMWKKLIDSILIPCNN